LAPVYHCDITLAIRFEAKFPHSKLRWINRRRPSWSVPVRLRLSRRKSESFQLCPSSFRVSCDCYPTV